MATSSFKSSSKRPTTSSSTSSTSINKQPLQQHSRKPQTSTQKALPRRSRSVSSFPRTQLDITSEFQNKRDNPLFWVDGSPNNSEEDIDMVKLSNFEIPKIVGVDNLHNLKGDFDGGGDSRRGRSALRNSSGEPKFSNGDFGGGRKDVGRSLSRVDTGRRRRSPSRGHYGNSEFEKEQESELLNSRSRSNISSKANRALVDKKSNLARSASDFSELLKGRNTWSSQHPASETSDDSAINLSGSLIPHWDDERSTSSISEAEEKTINAVSEEKITPLKDNSRTTGGIFETVRSEVRRVISDLQSDLKHCEERTRKLRAELAVEEHRESELFKILNDTVPEPKTPVVQKTRAVRKASFERKKMSRHLEEDALAFFDECASISTFDQSDFSSIEDIPSMVSVDGPGSERVGLPGVPSRFSDAYSFETQRTPFVECHEGSPLKNIHNSSLSKSPSISLEEDIRNYVKSFSKDSGGETSNSDNTRTSTRRIEDYNCEVPAEKLLLDRVTFRSRIESGGMLLCGGGAGFSVAPFSSVLW
ncbi:uncharacterized protein LOC110682651 isoform X2 [Chenopodium quinoa]|uniref:uncharacterized protein LOC110682651 isoform X2 n=1 Tax=Chenopodium quinoa TaxID=63459 RepID=UPI000B796530|nr:uncharacterized protein LOC110682651 isoform X2 [Chenopodium quinoa]